MNLVIIYLFTVLFILFKKTVLCKNFQFSLIFFLFSKVIKSTYFHFDPSKLLLRFKFIIETISISITPKGYVQLKTKLNIVNVIHLSLHLKSKIYDKNDCYSQKQLIYDIMF